MKISVPKTLDRNTVVSETAFDLADTMGAVLEAVELTYTTNNVPMPDRRYWIVGKAAEDCEQITVEFLQSYLGPPGDQGSEPQTCHAPRTAMLRINVTRDTPVGMGTTPPSVAEIEAANTMHAVDAMMLYESLKTMDSAVGWAGYIATVSSGGAGGGVTTVSMDLTIGVGVYGA